MNKFARLRFRSAWLFACLVAVTGPAFAQTGPVGYWKFDEGAGTAPQDSSGNANHCTMSPAPTWTTGKLNGALSFDGVDDSVNCGTGATLGTLSQMSVSAWVNLTTVGEGGLGRIAQKGTGGNPTAGWRLVTSGTRQLEFAIDYGSGDLDRVSSVSSFSFGQWTHVIATWSGTTSAADVHIYVNGVEVDYPDSGDNGVGTRNSDSSAPLWIGNTSTGGSTTKGGIDDVRIYNRVLSLAEIQALADGVAPGAPTGLGGSATSSQVNLNWTAATDNIGVTGYMVERCVVASCTFSQIATPSGTTYGDTGVSPSTTYRYRVRATDANLNVGPYSITFDATTAPPAGGSGPVGYWKFDEGSGTAPQDSSGNANHCTMSPAPTWTTGKFNNALSFDGVDDSVNCGTGATLGTLSQMTVAAWVNLTTVGEGGLGRIAQKGTGGNPSAGWRLVTSGTRQLEFAIDYGTGDLDRVSSTNSFPFSTWAHVAATWSGTTTATDAHIYVNGVEVSYPDSGDNGVGTRNSDTTAPLWIGNTSTGASTTKGSIDDVRIYNRVLTSAEIQALADTTAPTAPAAVSTNTASNTQIDVSWLPSTDAVGVTGYLVERCLDASCTFSQVGTPIASPFSDSGLTPSTAYQYRIRATDANSNLSGYSTPVTGSTSVPITGLRRHAHIHLRRSRSAADHARQRGAQLHVRS